jgi:type II secretory pathway pseudopilin PulG
MVERYQELLRRRQEAKENGEEAGFTLIELLIVIVV